MVNKYKLNCRSQAITLGNLLNCYIECVSNNDQDFEDSTSVFYNFSVRII